MQPTFLASARSWFGSNSPPDCYSLPHRHFVTSRRRLCFYCLLVVDRLFRQSEGFANRQIPSFIMCYAVCAFYQAVILVDSVCKHCICNLLEACDVCACDKVITKTVLFCSSNRNLMDVSHNAAKLFVNFLFTPSVTH